MSRKNAEPDAQIHSGKAGLLKLLRSLGQNRSTWNLSAISISNGVDGIHSVGREAEYKSLIGSYSKEDAARFSEQNVCDITTAEEPTARTAEPIPDYAENADGQFAMF